MWGLLSLWRTRSAGALAGGLLLFGTRRRGRRRSQWFMERLYFPILFQLAFLAQAAPDKNATYYEGTAGYQYVVRIPLQAAAPAKPAPLIIMLHGAVPTIKLMDLTRFGPMAYGARHADFPFVVACPLTHTGWSLGTLRQFAQGLKSAFPQQIDWSRVYFTGDSMGGHATWMWGCADRQLFAALAPVCGAGDAELASQRLGKMPVWIFHGEKDPVVPVSYGKRMHAALLRVNGPVRATWYPDVGHDAWTPAWKTPELYDWFLQQTNAINGPAGRSQASRL